MKTITSALAVSVFLSFLVWISTLAFAGADRRIPGWYGRIILHLRGTSEWPQQSSRPCITVRDIQAEGGALVVEPRVGNVGL